MRSERGEQGLERFDPEGRVLQVVERVTGTVLAELDGPARPHEMGEGHALLDLALILLQLMGPGIPQIRSRNHLDVGVTYRVPADEEWWFIVIIVDVGLVYEVGQVELRVVVARVLEVYEVDLLLVEQHVHRVEVIMAEHQPPTGQQALKRRPIPKMPTDTFHNSLFLQRPLRTSLPQNLLGEHFGKIAMNCGLAGIGDWDV
jgi:hypothetical protein